MATLEENIQKVANLKSSLQTQFENKGIDYTGVSFENYGNIVRDDMEKVLIEQSKDVTPTTSAQTITPDDGYKLTQVNVEAIQVEQKEVKSSLVSQTILPSTGKFISQITVQPLDLETKIVSPTTSQQEITSSADKDGIEKVIVEAITLQEKTVQPSTEIQEISPDLGIQGLSSVTVNKVTKDIDENIKSSNIKSGISILGVEGSAEVVSRIRDTSDTTATPEDVISGYVFYDNEDVKTTGNVQSFSGGTYTTNQILNTANKYLTGDIIINVPDGNTRLENDSLYKMKSIDIMRFELEDVLYPDLPKDEEYLEQQTFIDGFLSDINSNITNFIDYSVIQCSEELFKTLKFKNLVPSKASTLDTLVNLVNNITYIDKEPLSSTVDTEDTTATANNVRLGRLFYNKDGNKTLGTIDSNVGRRVDINQTISTANKYITSDIEIFVPSGDKNVNETLNEMITTDIMRYNMGDVLYENLPTEEEYIAQQTEVNNLIYEIQGVKF